MDSARDQRDRIVSTGERPIKPENAVEQPLSPKDERIVSANPSTDAAIIGPSRDVQQKTGIADPSRYFGVIQPPNAHSSSEQDASHGGYAHGINPWDGYPQYVTPEGLHVSQAIYNENPSMLFQSGFGFSPEMLYGQFSPVAPPMPSMMLEGQLYAPQQIPFSPSYYPQPGPLDVPSGMPISPSEFIASKNSGENMLFGPGSGYMVPFGSFGIGNISGNPGTSPLVSSAPYPQTMGILGSYEQNTGQIPLHGYGIASSSSFGSYPHGGTYQGTFGNASVPYFGADDRARLAFETGKRRERDQDSISISISSDSHGNRGPRALKVKGKSASEPGSSSRAEKDKPAASVPDLYFYNRPEFVTDYENAKFFVIKSFSEDNVHRSIKYNVWASTPHGNKKLDAAYQEAKAKDEYCPVFLFFSVNASGQFCGVAEMVGPVDFEKDADYWQQDRWSGQFPVKWHIIKDVPNSRFRHILLENNDNKPVTHSRDSQEVKLEQGFAMLKIFKDYDARTSILDDFCHYDEKEKVLQDRKARQLASSAAKGDSEQISDRFAQSLSLEDASKEKQATGASSSSRTHPIRESPQNISQPVQSEEKRDGPLRS